MIVCCVPGWRPATRGALRLVFVMLAAFIDDSGSERQGPVIVLAGYMSKRENWDRFSDEWEQALNRHPQLEYFKIKEAARLEEQFGRFTRSERDKRVLEFTSIIRRYAFECLVCSMSWDDFVILEAEYPELTLHPYDTLFFGLMGTVVEHVSRLNEKLLFIFDDQNKDGQRTQSNLRNIIQLLPSQDRKTIIGVAHLNDKIVLPLQSADTIAWLMRRHAYENPACAKDLGDWKAQKDYLKPLQGIPRLHTYYPLERLRPICERFRESARSRRRAADPSASSEQSP